jgi:hypothetical protein
MLNGQLNVAPSVSLFSAELRPERRRQKRRLGRSPFTGGGPGLGGGEAASVYVDFFYFLPALFAWSLGRLIEHPCGSRHQLAHRAPVAFGDASPGSTVPHPRLQIAAPEAPDHG